MEISKGKKLKKRESERQLNRARACQDEHGDQQGQETQKRESERQLNRARACQDEHGDHEGQETEERKSREKTRHPRLGPGGDEGGQNGMISGLSQFCTQNGMISGLSQFCSQNSIVSVYHNSVRDE